MVNGGCSVNARDDDDDDSNDDNDDEGSTDDELGQARQT